MISVLVLTKNEEVNIQECLESLQWSDDVVVFDSFSTDKTVEIAESMGARVFQREFDNYGSQREAARQVDYKHAWVLAVDADERPDKTLVDEIRQVAESEENDVVAYRMRRKDHFMGKWIKHSSLYPSWFVRLYRHAEVRYEPRAVHEYPSHDGDTGELKGHLLHFSFNKRLEDWFHKHVTYARLEAEENLSSLRKGQQDLLGVFSVFNPVRRRRALKELSFRMPCRPLLRFVYMYVLRGGVLDGRQGLQYCRMLAMYEQMIVYQMRDLSAGDVESDAGFHDAILPLPQELRSETASSNRRKAA